MRDFIERVRKAYNSPSAWDREPLFFKTFMWVLIVVGGILKLIYCAVVSVTIPLWIVPYIIYSTRRNKDE